MFDGTVMQLFMALSQGASFLIVSESVRQSPSSLASVLNATATVLQVCGVCTPDMWCLYSRYVVSVLQVCGVCTPGMWCLYSRYVVSVLQVCGVCTPGMWCLYTRYVVSVHQVCGVCTPGTYVVSLLKVRSACMYTRCGLVCLPEIVYLRVLVYYITKDSSFVLCFMSPHACTLCTHHPLGTHM